MIFTMRRSVAVAATACLLSAGTMSLLGSSPATAASPSCDGQPATIVGTPGQTLMGTTGPDVIVSNGATRVDAGDGEDVICLTNGDALLVTDDTDFDGPQPPAKHDVVFGGDDNYYIFSGFQENQPNDDDITLGNGNNEVAIAGLPTGTVTSGTDHNTLHLLGRNPPSLVQAWEVDNANGTITVNGTTGTVSGFDAFDFSRVDFSSFTFIGSAANESVDFVANHRLNYITRPTSSSYDTNVDLRLGAGNDRASVYTFTQGPVAGGGGTNTLEVTGEHHLVATISPSRVRLARSPMFNATKFTNLVASADYVKATGDDRANRLRLSGRCNTHVAGGGGNDHITSTGAEHTYGCKARTFAATIQGGPGNDVLMGTNSDDHLLGGPGHDVARGNRGQDTCSAEVVRDCER